MSVTVQRTTVALSVPVLAVWLVKILPLGLLPDGGVGRLTLGAGVGAVFTALLPFIKAERIPQDAQGWTDGQGGSRRPLTPTTRPSSSSRSAAVRWVVPRPPSSSSSTSGGARSRMRQDTLDVSRDAGCCLPKPRHASVGAIAAPRSAWTSKGSQP